MKRRSIAVAALSLVAGCTHSPTLVPDPLTETRSLARATAAGVTLEVVANAWREYPTAVADQLTPLWLHVQNDGDAAFDITYAALQAVDEQGRVYAAIPPLEVVRMVVGSTDPVTESSPVEVAETDADTPQIQLAQFGFGAGIGPDSSWGSPNSPYGGGSPTNAAAPILGRALREGRLLPHTQAMGFVYFQRAYSGHALTVRLTAPAEAPGAPPLVLETRFTVQP